jgi:hypothetical protein
MKYNREYPIRMDVIFQSNKFKVYHFKPLSQYPCDLGIQYETCTHIFLLQNGCITIMQTGLRILLILKLVLLMVSVSRLL